MGLTANSTGLGAVDSGLHIEKQHPSDQIVALAGNPNVGKSTVFNELTGMNQHTGNWPGKTVTSAQGTYHGKEGDVILVDLPGTYSLMAHSAEEEIARDFICFGGADAAVVVCDATCLERNLNLALQTIEITPDVVVCVNLMDEAEKKKIRIDLPALEKELGVPIVAAQARSGKGLDKLIHALSTLPDTRRARDAVRIRYPEAIEQAIEEVEPTVRLLTRGRINSRWLALKLLDPDDALLRAAAEFLGTAVEREESVARAVKQAWKLLDHAGITRETMRDEIVAALVEKSEQVTNRAVVFENKQYNRFDRRLDRILTNKITGIPIMLALLCGIFWLTISGANYPSQLLSTGLFWIQDRLTDFFLWAGAPDWLYGALVQGVYRVLAWVVSVMLPPMAIFFPLFTLLEDFGYLPRVAFNLDHSFKKARACGKQALTMCMGFGCNAAGIVGCRIIDSPRERMIAILTNNFVPCNGRFPSIISVISMFFVGTAGGMLESLKSTLILMGVIVLGVALTFLVSSLLSRTILKGKPSSFTLELPPYRRPQIGKVIVRSLFDRTLFVLGRAAAVAAPAGLLIWIMANVTVGDMSLLAHCSQFLDPFGRLLGMDGVILLAFLLGFPANEIVIPIMITAYLASGSLVEMDNLLMLKSLLVDNGWTWVTAVSTMLFCLIHWPCSTTCLTIRKETQSVKWTAVAFALPTVVGILVCFLFTSAVRLLRLA